MFKSNHHFGRIKRQLQQEDFEVVHEMMRPAECRAKMFPSDEGVNQSLDAEYGLIAIHNVGVIAAVYAETWRDHVEVKLYTTVVQRLPLTVNWQFITDISITKVKMSHRARPTSTPIREEMIARPPRYEMVLDLNYFLLLERPNTESREVHNTIGHAMRWIASWASFDYWNPHWYSHHGHFDLNLVKRIMGGAPKLIEDNTLDHFGFAANELLRLIERIPAQLHWRFMHPLRDMENLPEDLKARFDQYALN